MKKVLYVISMFALLLLIAPSHIANAQANVPNAPYSAELAASISQNCSTITNSLVSLRKRDISTRVSRVYVYEFLLQRTQAFGTRLKNNKLEHKAVDGDNQIVELQLSQFKQDYDSYDDHLTNLIATNCNTDPQDFYNKLTSVRAERKQLASDVQNIHESWQKIIKDIKAVKLSNTANEVSK